MKAKEFEEHCLYRMRKNEERNEATMGRYGVQGVYMRNEKNTEQMLWKPIRSLPDFEGVIPGGRQFIFDCKVCSAASFPLDETFFKRRQLKHMITRARFGVICFLLIHFPKRIMKKQTDLEETWAFPIEEDHPFWIAFDHGEKKRITREDCREYAVKVSWTTLGISKTQRPDILGTIMCFDRGRNLKSNV
jgi:penicillin-binding protein-related factor A (putative recombinase)